MKSILKFGLVLLLLQAVTNQAAPIVTQAAAGGNYSLFLTLDGSLWGMGYDVDGELGVGGTFKISQPEEIVSNDVVSIAAGGAHSLFIKSDGSLWAMGYNYYGQLGDGSINHASAYQPEEIVSNDVVAIAAGAAYTLFIKSDGSLWAMGYNEYGQLGDETYNNTNQPEEVVSNDVVAIAAGGAHSLFLKSDGSLWAMGYNGYGQLGDGTYNNTNRPEEVISNDVVAITAGGVHSLFLKSDGSLWAMGNNEYGQLGDGTYNNTNQPEEVVSNDVVAISAEDSEHTLFIKSDGSLWGMGYNGFGQLGDGTTNNANQPEEIISNGVVAVTTGGTDDNIAGGGGHTLFIKSDGSLWGMGRGHTGELGDGFIAYYYGPYYYGGNNPSPEQIFPRPQPVLTLNVSSKNLQFNATCHFAGTYHVLMSMNLTTPLRYWSSVAPSETINVSSNNNFNLTIPNLGNYLGLPQFYILQAQ